MTRGAYLLPPAERDLDRLDPDVRERILEGIRRYVRTQHGDVLKLKGREDLWRLRVGDWRVIFRFVGKTESIEIQEIVHRGKGYRAHEDLAPYESEEPDSVELAMPQIG